MGKHGFGRDSAILGSCGSIVLSWMRFLILMSKKLKFKSYISTETVFANRNWQVGDEIELPDFFGKALFTLKRKTDTELEWWSGDLVTFFTKRGKDWVWEHIIINGAAIAKINFV